MENIKEFAPLATVVLGVVAVFGLFTWLNSSVKADVRDVRQEVTQLRTELKSEISQLRTDFNQLRTDFNQRFDKLYELHFQNKRETSSRN